MWTCRFDKNEKKTFNFSDVFKNSPPLHRTDHIAVLLDDRRFCAAGHYGAFVPLCDRRGAVSGWKTGVLERTADSGHGSDFAGQHAAFLV